MSAEVIAITGAGGMGEAIARRLGAGRVVVLADASEQQLANTSERLQGIGHDVRTVRTDISSADEVAAFARAASDLGRICCIAHTAGVSPVQATPEQIVAVDVVGTARVLDTFEPFVEPGTVAVCIASMAGTMTTVDAETLQVLATTPSDDLHELAVLDPARMDPGTAYGIAKRANQARVQAVSVRWGRKGGRVVSISPGIIATPMGHAELAGPFGDVMRDMLKMSGTGRVGTPDDIAAAVEFLASPAASFITGVDLLVDGGVVAAMHYGAPTSAS